MEPSIIDYGVVRIARGKFKGKIGYYDDDEWTKGGRHVAIVFFGVPLGTGYEFVPFHYLREPSKTEEDAFRKRYMGRSREYTKAFKAYANGTFFGADLLVKRAEQAMPRSTASREKP